ncbi:hypothetical protein, partial [Shigella boydii]|uniref:hypothetical protein n=2 Tax=Shigella TaxID=620 RepID=UPI003CF710B0
KRAYCLKTQPATGETYPKSDLFNKAMSNDKCHPSIMDKSGPKCNVTAPFIRHYPGAYRHNIHHLLYVRKL